MNENELNSATLAGIARQLSDLQQQILKALRDKGPGLLLEVAVRVLKFQDDVQTPLLELQSLGLVETQRVSGGPFGTELFSLTLLGNRVLHLLNDPQFAREQRATAAQNPQQQEVELLNKLGDVAKQKGDLDQALNFYKQALNITRDLSGGDRGAK